MKKRFQFRMLARQIAERFATILLGLVCLALIIHYWPADDAGQTGPSQGGLVSKVIVMIDAQKIILLQKKSPAGLNRLVKQALAG